MKLITLEGNRDSSLHQLQYQLSGGMAGGDLSGLRSRAKSAVSKATSAVSNVAQQATALAQQKAQDAVNKAKDEASQAIEKAKQKAIEEGNQLKAKAIEKAKELADKQKARIKTKLKEYSNIDKFVEMQLKASSMYIDEFLNSVPIVGTVNRGITMATGGTSLTELVIEKGGMKVYGYTSDKVKDQTNKLIAKYIPAVNDAEIPQLQTGVFDSYLNDNPDFILFGKSKAELSAMPPSEMYSLINTYLASNNLEKLISVADSQPPDVAKMYYITAGQPLYNLYNKVLYNAMIKTSEENNALMEDPSKAETIAVSMFPDDSNVRL